jgi:hypothetical protein
MTGVLPLALLFSRLPVSFDGLVVFEGIVMFLLSLGGVPPAEGVAVALMARVVKIVSCLPSWISFVWEHKGLMPLRETLSADR